jgi:hypothetical protein
MVASPAKPEVGDGGLNECQLDAADVPKRHLACNDEDQAKHHFATQLIRSVRLHWGLVMFVEIGRLLIRPFCPDDAGTYYQIVADPGVMCLLTEKPQSFSAAR